MDQARSAKNRRISASTLRPAAACTSRSASSRSSGSMIRLPSSPLLSSVHLASRRAVLLFPWVKGSGDSECDCTCRGYGIVEVVDGLKGCFNTIEFVRFIEPLVVTPNSLVDLDC